MSRAGLWAVPAVCAVFAVGHGVQLGWSFLAGVIWGEPLLQYPDQHLVWSPYIHPPLYAEFLIVLWGVADAFDVDPQYYVYLYAAVVSGACALIAGLWAGHRSGIFIGAVAAVLVTLSPATLRPYEEYPLMRGLLLLVALPTLAYVRSGNPRWAAAAVVAGFVAAELHLSAWFVTGPLFAAIFFGVPERRRGIFVSSVVVIGAFLATTSGLWEVLRDGPDHSPGWVTPPWHETVSLEWTNPLLFVPLLLWALPAIRRTDPEGWLLGAAALGYTAVTLGLQVAGLAIGGGGGVNAHHYFELIDALLALAAAIALGAALRAYPMYRSLLVAGTLALVATQVAGFLWGRSALRDAAFGISL